METTDETIIQEYREGRNENFSLLVYKYLDSLYNFAFTLAGDEALAEDIVQEAFIKAWKKIQRFDITQKFRPWLFAIARNTALDMLRKKRPLLFSELERGEEEQRMDFEVVDLEPLPDEVFHIKEIEKKIQEALRSVPLRQREILLLKSNIGMTFEEIAQLLNRPMNTVKSDYRRGLEVLRKCTKNASWYV